MKKPKGPSLDVPVLKFTKVSLWAPVLVLHPKNPYQLDPWPNPTVPLGQREVDQWRRLTVEDLRRIVLALEPADREKVLGKRVAKRGRK